MRRAVLAMAIVAFAAAASCAGVETKAYDYAQKMVDTICKQPQNVRDVERTKLWEAFGIDTTQTCIEKSKRVKPPTIP